MLFAKITTIRYQPQLRVFLRLQLRYASLTLLCGDVFGIKLRTNGAFSCRKTYHTLCPILGFRQNSRARSDPLADKGTGANYALYHLTKRLAGPFVPDNAVKTTQIFMQ
jgi:hypothetical protein